MLLSVLSRIFNRINPAKAGEDRHEILPLTGLRFIAALLVYIFHIHSRWSLADGAFFRNILGQGAIGMSLFFMLSGFVLAYRYTDQTVSYKDYFINRIARIYPIYGVAALLTLPWFGIMIEDDSPWALWQAIGQGFILVITDILMLQAWIPGFFKYWNNGGSWSISVEFFCYAIFPFALARLFHRDKKQIFYIMMACWILAVLPGAITKIFLQQPKMVIYFMPIFRLPEFLIGICLYLLIRQGIRYRWGSLPQCLVLILLAVYLGIAGPLMPFYVGHNWLVVPVIGFMIFSLANNKGFIATILSNRVSVWLGKISYCFYSLQTFLIIFLITYYDVIIRLYPMLKNNHLFCLVFLIILTVAAGLSYHLVEEPARRLIKKRFK